MSTTKPGHSRACGWDARRLNCGPDCPTRQRKNPSCDPVAVRLDTELETESRTETWFYAGSLIGYGWAGDRACPLCCHRFDESVERRFAGFDATRDIRVRLKCRCLHVIVEFEMGTPSERVIDALARELAGRIEPAIGPQVFKLAAHAASWRRT